MYKRICLSFLALLVCSAVFAQPQKLSLGINSGVMQYTNTENGGLSGTVKPDIDLDTYFNLGRSFNTEVDFDAFSFISKNHSPIFSLDGMLSLNYNIPLKNCYSDEEKYAIGIALNSTITSNKLFANDLMTKMTLGLKAGATMGLVSIDIFASPLNLAPDNNTASYGCFDINAQVCVNIPDSGNPPMFNRTDNTALHHSITATCKMFRAKQPTTEYSIRTDNSKPEELKNTRSFIYADSNVKYEYTIPNNPIAVNVCVGLQYASESAQEDAENGNINYYCTAGVMWKIPLK